MSAAGLAPDSRETTCPPRNTISVGIERMRKRSPSAGTASVSTLATTALPASVCATFSTSGAIMWHGPHHGAQKSTTTGTGDFVISASKAGTVATSTGLAAAGSVVLQWPHLI